MKAIAYVAPGELAVVDRQIPRPGRSQVLVEVAYTGICGTDLLIWHGGLARVVPPVVLGHEFCGRVADANGHPGVSVGDRVAVEPLLWCGQCRACRTGNYNVCAKLRLIGVDIDGAAAPFVAADVGRLHRLPDSLAMRDAALTEPTAVAVHMVRRSGLSRDDRVLILGGGPIGALVAHVCRATGVTDLVISEPNADRRALLAGLRFDVFDPFNQPGSELRDRGGADGFDVVFELTGVDSSLIVATDAVRAHGTILLGGIPGRPLPVAISVAVMKELSLLGARVYRSQDFARAVELLAGGSVSSTALITREVPLAEAIGDAFGRLESHRDDMKILLTSNGTRPADGAGAVVRAERGIA